MSAPRWPDTRLTLPTPLFPKVADAWDLSADLDALVAAEPWYSSLFRFTPGVASCVDAVRRWHLAQTMSPTRRSLTDQAVEVKIWLAFYPSYRPSIVRLVGTRDGTENSVLRLIATRDGTENSVLEFALVLVLPSPRVLAMLAAPCCPTCTASHCQLHCTVTCTTL